MILEGIVTTVSPAGEVNIAPMGPRVPPGFPGARGGIELRPFRTSRTYQNLHGHREAVLHATDDVLLLARAALGALDPLPPLRRAEHVDGWVLADCCHYHELRIVSWDDREERSRLQAEVVASGRVRDFFGLNRAMHAVVEAAILATRTAFLPLAEIDAEYHALAVLVEKTGGPREKEAFALLRAHLDACRASRPPSPVQKGPTGT